MNYVRGLGSSVSTAWNSINPATLSGAIDVVVVEQRERPGGRAYQLKDGGFTWDTGPSLVTMPWVLEETFAAGGLDPFEAASVGSWLHGAAATAASRGGPIVAGDVARALPGILRELVGESGA